MASTTLAGAAGLNDRFVTLTSAAGVAKKDKIIVDDEKMLVSDDSLTPTLGVVRGIDGTAAAAHGLLAPVDGGPTLTQWPPTSTVAPESIGADATVGADYYADQNVYLTKATALAITLANPTYKSQKNTIRFIASGAGAHVITYTQGFYRDTTGSDTATFNAGGGGVLTIQAQQGAWVAIATASIGVVIG